MRRASRSGEPVAGPSQEVGRHGVRAGAYSSLLLRNGETAQRLGLLPAWGETEVFTPAECSALTPAEATANLRGSARGAAAAAARAELTGEQISSALWAAISINAVNRVSIMSGHPVKEA